tara:strand:+ start:114 stop:701 length:588 start_codon:yes stop_codon:yes gene_type:complete
MGGYHGNGNLPNFILLKRLLSHIGLCLLCLSANLGYADIGETYSLKQERALLLSEIHELKQDSLSTKKVALIDSLTELVFTLDGQIFTSYDESISRISSQKLEHGANDKLAVYMALGATTIALFFAFLLLMARSRVQNNGAAGLGDMYRQLTIDFIGAVSPEKALTQRLLRVNIVVIVGLMIMSVSIVAYLLSAL